MKNLIFTICLLGIFSSCSMFENSPTENKQNIYFEVEHISYAWGYQHAGFYVHRKGEVFTYQYESNNAPWQPNENNYYTEAELLKKFQPSKRHVNSIDLNSLADKVELILPAMQSVYSDTSFVRVDGPTTNYICYYFDESKDKYLRVALLSDGDWFYKKESQESDEMVKWLKTLVVK